MSRGIFNLSAEGCWFASVFCTQKMFNHVSDALPPEMLVKQANLEMSMSVWHKHVVVPTTNYVTGRHTIPGFAEKALGRLKKLGPCNKAIALHLSLLIQAWKALIKACKETLVGPNTLDEIRNWISFMSITKDSSLFDATPPALRAQFLELFEVDLPRSVDSVGRQEHPHFSHEILFLQIAHMIWFYCKNNLNSDFPNIRDSSRLVVTHDNEMSEWERLSGELFQEIFSLDGAIEEWDHFEYIQLPYDMLHELVEKDDAPSVGHLHSFVLSAFHNFVQSNIYNSLPSQWQNEGPILQSVMIFSETKFVIKYKDVFKNRKSTRNHYMKNRTTAKEYKPKQRYYFQRDIFIMGLDSHHYKNTTDTGRAMSKFQFIYPASECITGVMDNDSEQTSDTDSETDSEKKSGKTLEQELDNASGKLSDQVSDTALDEWDDESDSISDKEKEKKTVQESMHL
jgi:hypothetical protein